MEIIDDIRRGYNLYKRPRFQRERDIEVVTSNDMDGPGEVASPTHSVSGSILRALAERQVASVCRCRGEEQREVDLGRSAQPDAIVPVTFNPGFTKALAGSEQTHQHSLGSSPWCESTK